MTPREQIEAWANETDVREIQTSKVYCEYCMVVPIERGDDKYCIGCVNDIIAYLAQEWNEQALIDRGLY